MPSIPSHAVAAMAIGKTFTGHPLSWRFWIATIVLSALPDADSVGYFWGIPYGSLLGHRGLTHSFAFAAAASGLTVLVFFRSPISVSRKALFFYFFLVTASHGLLDALTNGGLGVAFFSPFSNERYFFPWRPIAVSPMAVGRFLSYRGWKVVESEAVWVWLPFWAIALSAFACRKIQRK